MKRIDFHEYYGMKLQQFLFRWVDAAKLKLLKKELADFRDEDIILDLGSGAGNIPVKLNKKTICLDKNIELAKICRRRGLNAIVADIENPLPFMDKSISTVLLIDTIEHIKYPHKLLGEIKRILKEDGKLIVFTPAYDSVLWLLAEQIHHILTRKKSDHITPMTKESLEFLISENFSRYKIQRINFMLGLVAVVS